MSVVSLMNNAFKKVGQKFVHTIGYNPAIIGLLNSSSYNIKIDKEKSASIGRNTTIVGELFLGENVTIEDDCFLRGSIQIEDDSEIRAGTRITTDVSISNNVRIGRNSTIERGNVTIDSHTNLVRNNGIYGDIYIGKYNAIAPNVVLRSGNHPTNKASMQISFYDEFFDENLQHISKGPITVGSDVWIGTNVTILSGVEIGHGAVVGAGSVVTKDVDPYSIVAGVPAKHLKWRFPAEIRQELQEIQWWNWSECKIKNNKQFFTTDLASIDDLGTLLNE